MVTLFWYMYVYIYIHIYTRGVYNNHPMRFDCLEKGEFSLERERNKEEREWGQVLRYEPFSLMFLMMFF